METLPSDSRQPPDGHEFPDSIEDNTSESQKLSAINYYKYLEEDPFDNYKVQGDISAMEEFPKKSNLTTSQSVSASNSDLRQVNRFDSEEDLENAGIIPEPSPLHTRSQSLIDMTSLSKQKNAKLNQLIEQRRKSLSKLKGLVIPESSEVDTLPPSNLVHIPEIKSHNTATFIPVPKVDSSCNNSLVLPENNASNGVKPPIVVPPWTSSSPNNLPKYSPAFKRKSLQVYPIVNTKNDNNHDYVINSEFSKYCDKSKTKACDDDLNPPKSLESISSPTRSDCSFDYVSNSKKYTKEITDTLQKIACKLEDESDNDSAVSSSQSSYNSRFSPPPSPTRSCDDDHRNPQRLLKPSSVEAINRKNILASAKCRSGKDLTMGSPVIKRKTEETKVIENEIIVPKVSAEVVLSPVVDVKSDVEVSELSPAVTPPTAPVPESEPPGEATNTKVPNTTSAIDKDITQVRPSRPTFVPLRSPIGRSTEDLRPNKSPPNRDLFASSNVLNRKSQPINVKALKANFESFGSAPPMPQKVPNYKTQITATPKIVKANIAKAESEIASANVPVLAKKPGRLIDIKPTEVSKRASLIETRTSLNETRTSSTELRKSSVPRTDAAKDVSKRNSNIVSLKLETVGSSLGITLAGGVDEEKEITIHRIRYGSIAYHDGRLKRGDKVVSVNSHPTKGLTHAEATELLKEPVIDFIIQIEEGIEPAPSNLTRRSSSTSTLAEMKPTVEVPEKSPNHVITFIKDGAGLGFSIEGGKDSPVGDMPLIIKKIFTGGAADKNAQLKIGDEIIMVNDFKFKNLSRIEAWNLMKKIPDGSVNIHIYR